jgi:hypothetical protein
MTLLQVPNISEPLVGTQKINHRWWSWLEALWRYFSTAYSGKVALPAATPGGAAGEMVFENGVLTKYTAPT